MKILFVLPSDDLIYGSGRSILQLARALDVKFDLLIGKSLQFAIHEENLWDNFGSNLEKIYQMWLPNTNFYYGASSHPLIGLAALHKYLMWIHDRGKFKRLVHKNKYDVIHLNSMILCPMLQKEYRMIAHVREVFEGAAWKRRYIQSKLRQARGVIYINPSTRNALDDRTMNSVIIQDPFEMTHIADLDASEIRQKLAIEKDAVVFSILGRYEDRNGTEFIINTFHRTSSKNIVLLVGGKVLPDEQKKIRDTIGEDDRIRLLGEWGDPSPIFAISDYILRGERFFSGFSRTVYEGLYSGCRVIFPGRREEAVDSLQYETFQDRLIFYPPRNEAALIQVIDQCAQAPVVSREYMSNRQEYVSDYLRLIDKICRQ